MLLLLAAACATEEEAPVDEGPPLDTLELPTSPTWTCPRLRRGVATALEVRGAVAWRGHSPRSTGSSPAAPTCGRRADVETIEVDQDAGGWSWADHCEDQQGRGYEGAVWWSSTAAAEGDPAEADGRTISGERRLVGDATVTAGSDTRSSSTHDRDAVTIGTAPDYTRWTWSSAVDATVTGADALADASTPGGWRADLYTYASGGDADALEVRGDVYLFEERLAGRFDSLSMDLALDPSDECGEPRGWLSLRDEDAYCTTSSSSRATPTTPATPAPTRPLRRVRRLRHLVPARRRVGEGLPGPLLRVGRSARGPVDRGLRPLDPLALTGGPPCSSRSGSSAAARKSPTTGSCSWTRAPSSSGSRSTCAACTPPRRSSSPSRRTRASTSSTWTGTSRTAPPRAGARDLQPPLPHARRRDLLRPGGGGARRRREHAGRRRGRRGAAPRHLRRRERPAVQLRRDGGPHDGHAAPRRLLEPRVPEGETGWQPATWRDARPAAGVLSMTGIWQRFPSMGGNANGTAPTR